MTQQNVKKYSDKSGFFHLKVKNQISKKNGDKIAIKMDFFI